MGLNKPLVPYYPEEFRNWLFVKKLPKIKKLSKSVSCDIIRDDKNKNYKWISTYNFIFKKTKLIPVNNKGILSDICKMSHKNIVE